MHQPVLLNEVITMAKDSKNSPRFLFDGTFGRGGHTRALLEEFDGLKVFAMDQDQSAKECVENDFSETLEKRSLLFKKDNFLNFENYMGEWKEFSGTDLFDLMLLDLGVSSPQLDEADRGFSFYHSGPLDMRMDQSLELTASEIVNEWEDKELSDLFFHFGEVRYPNKVVRAIVEDRKTKKFETTEQLAQMIERVSGWRKKGKHPATQYFLALRLAVNSELEVIEKTIPKLVKYLKPAGRLMIISFHSLEDRIVKVAFKELKSKGHWINKKVIQSSDEELKSNPRARSAKLRGFEMGAGE